MIDPPTPRRINPPAELYIIMSPYIGVCCVYITLYVCVRDMTLSVRRRWRAGYETCRQENPQNSCLTINKVCYCWRRRRRAPLFMCLFLLFILLYDKYKIYIYLCAITVVYLFSSLNI